MKFQIYFKTFAKFKLPKISEPYLLKTNKSRSFFFFFFPGTGSFYVSRKFAFFCEKDLWYLAKLAKNAKKRKKNENMRNAKRIQWLGRFRLEVPNLPSSKENGKVKVEEGQHPR